MADFKPRDSRGLDLRRHDVQSTIAAVKQLSPELGCTRTTAFPGEYRITRTVAGTLHTMYATTREEAVAKAKALLLMKGGR